jgi:cytochrome b6-f complex iron-sulfur subunit
MSCRLQLRRDTFRWLISLPLAFILNLRDSAAQAKRVLSLDRVEKLKTIGGSILLKVEGSPVLFVRESEEVIRAVDPTCTHKKCTVEFNKKRKRFVCPCHGSQYDLEGKVLKGPAEKPLRNLNASLESGKIIFTLGESDE